MVLPIQSNQNTTAKKDIEWFSPQITNQQTQANNNPLNNKGAANIPVQAPTAVDEKKPE
jgi:hypothetical protein